MTETFRPPMFGTPWEASPLIRSASGRAFKALQDQVPVSGSVVVAGKSPVKSGKAESTIHERGEPKFRLLEDGSISTKRIERYVLFQVDEVPAAKAWQLAGYRNEGGSLVYRRKVEAMPEYRERLETLLAEKAELMKDEVWGEAKQMANQLWREARATNDPKMMVEAAKMRLNIAEKEAVQRPQAPASPGAGPGRTAVENPTNAATLDDVKRRLIEKGAPTPETKPVPAVPATAKTVVIKAATPPPAAPEPDTYPDLDAMLSRVPTEGVAA